MKAEWLPNLMDTGYQLVIGRTVAVIIYAPTRPDAQWITYYPRIPGMRHTLHPTLPLAQSAAFSAMLAQLQEEGRALEKMTGVRE